MKSLSEAEGDQLSVLAGQMRHEIVEMLATAGGGHFGGSLSVVEILVTLYGAVMRLDPTNPDWPDRDRLILSKGHACAALCPVLAHYGFLDAALLPTFNKLDSPLGMHPDMHKIPGCDMSTGSLGHGLAVGVGMALAGRADKRDYRVYVVLGDGECNEGTVWEAAMAASHFKLDNLIAIVDRNHVSLDGTTEDIMSLEPFAERWRSFGWEVIELDGHDFQQIYQAIQQAQSVRSRPTVLIADTVKGKGVSFMEGKHEYHYTVLTGEELEIARTEVGKES
jgi:transketolase